MSGCADDCVHPSHSRGRPVILGIVAPSGGGKTTVCRRLESAHGFVRIHVAQAIKDGFMAMFDAGPEYCESPLIDTPAGFLGGARPRDVLEHLGTRLHEVAPLAVPVTARAAICRLMGTQPRIIVDGIRRETESDTVRSLGGHVVRIAGHDIDPAKPCDLSQTKIISDYTLHFSNDLADLHREIDLLVATLSASREGRPGRRQDDQPKPVSFRHVNVAQVEALLDQVRVALRADT